MDSAASTHNPSFSSTLLDQIYRSIDEQHTNFNTRKSRLQVEDHNQRRAYLTQPPIGRRSAAERSSMRYERELFYGLNSTSTSSDSVKPAAIRTGNIKREESKGKLGKTKSKAMKIYSELKQPISPGGRLASFLNSLFTGTTGSQKKRNDVVGIISPQLDRKSKSTNASTCSSSSSAAAAAGKLNKLSNGIKTFYPLDCQQRMSINNKEVIQLDSSSDKNRRVSQGRRLFKTYQNRSECNLSSRKTNERVNRFGVDEQDDDESDSSSDLFELDHLSAHNKYREELPVYKTTKLDMGELFV